MLSRECQRILDLLPARAVGFRCRGVTAGIEEAERAARGGKGRIDEGGTCNATTPTVSPLKHVCIKVHRRLAKIGEGEGEGKEKDEEI